MEEHSGTKRWQSRQRRHQIDRFRSPGGSFNGTFFNRLTAATSANNGGHHIVALVRLWFHFRKLLCYTLSGSPRLANVLGSPSASRRFRGPSKSMKADHGPRSGLLEERTRMRYRECCPDCGVLPGNQHGIGCSIEPCPLCGGQYISCECDPDDLGYNEFPPVLWNGEIPRIKECREYGLYARLISGRGWVKCGPDEDGASLDINRLVTQGTWNRKTQKFELPSTAS